MRCSATVLAALLIAASTLGGCSASSIPATATPSETPAAATPLPEEPAELLAVGDAKLFEADKPAEAVEIAADGSVRFGGDVMATLSTDGKLTLPDGSVMMEVQADGSVLGRGEPTGLTVGGDGGTLRVGDETATVAFNEDGTVTVDPSPGPGAPAMAHEGCRGEMAKTCALVMFGMVASGETSGPESSPPSEDPVPPAPVN